MSFRLLFAVIALTLLPIGQIDSRAQTLHALSISDQSEWAGWGEFLPNVQMDSTYMFATLFNNVPERQLNMWPMAFEQGVPGSPQAILQAVDDLEVGPEDTLLVYYTGHGGADDQGHYLSLQKGKLYRTLLMYRMIGKGARLTVLVTDCCNVRGDGQEFGAPALELREPPRVTTAFQSLFFDLRGTVDVNSCAPGQSAYFFKEKDDFGMHQGSLFSRLLTKYLEKHQGRRLTWDEVLQDVDKDVQKAFRDNYPSGAAMAKGPRRQMAQTVYPISYPGMSVERGPRTGLTIRDHTGPGVLVTEVRSWSPAEQAYDLAAKKYVALQPDQVIHAANGRQVQGTRDFQEIVKETGKNRNGYKVMRLEIADPQADTKTYLLRLSH